MDVSRLVGRNIRRLRLERGISQEELAFQADLDRSYISGLERGRRNPSIQILQKVADGLGCTLVEIVSTDGDVGELPPNLPRGRRLK